MNAKEMFGKLGYIQVDEKTKEDIPRLSWGRDLERFEIVYKNNENIIAFYKTKTNFQNSYLTISYGSDDDDDREHYINMSLHKAIQKQIEELGW